MVLVRESFQKPILPEFYRLISQRCRLNNCSYIETAVLSRANVSDIHVEICYLRNLERWLLCTFWSSLLESTIELLDIF